MIVIENRLFGMQKIFKVNMEKVFMLTLIIAMATVAFGTEADDLKKYCCPASQECKVKDVGCKGDQIKQYRLNPNTGVACTLCPVCTEDCPGMVRNDPSGNVCIVGTTDLKGKADRCCPKTDFASCDKESCSDGSARINTILSKFFNTVWCPVCSVCKCSDTNTKLYNTTKNRLCIKFGA